MCIEGREACSFSAIQDEQCFVASHCASICRYLFAVINHLSACFDDEGRIALCYCPFPLAASHRQQLLLHCFCCAWLLLHSAALPLISTLLAACRVAYTLSSSCILASYNTCIACASCSIKSFLISYYTQHGLDATLRQGPVKGPNISRILW